MEMGVWRLWAQAVANQAERDVGGWAFDPRNGVLVLVILALVVGGLAKWGYSNRGRRAAERVADPKATEVEILESANYGRSAVRELFEALDPSEPPPRRYAAGRALAILWAADQLVPEEERGLVVRGYEVAWSARRRYPRAIDVPIPVAVRFGVPFLEAVGKGVKPESLEWSARLLGAHRASLEVDSDWRAGPGALTFQIDPNDLPGNGPYRLELHAKVRTRGLTSFWEFTLPAADFRLEFDPRLELDALLAAPDEDRLADASRSVTLKAPESTEAKFLEIGGGLVLRDPPAFQIRDNGLDLAHRVTLEFEAQPTSITAGPLVVSSDSIREAARTAGVEPVGVFPIAVPNPVEPALESPGVYRMRAILEPDPSLGWADPEVRSILPGRFATEWVEVRAIRA